MEMKFGLQVENFHIWKVTVKGEILSSKAWNGDKVRKGVWEKRFNYWFPLIINSNYCSRFQVENLLKKEICNATNTQEYKPELALSTIPRIMNRHKKNKEKKKINIFF